MPDFVIIVDPSRDRPVSVEQALRDRPGMSDLAVRTWRFQWGTASVQMSRCFGYEPYEADGTLAFCVGRPRIMGATHERNGPDGFTRALAEAAAAGDLAAFYERLTGVFALVVCADSGVTILTDRLGVYPVYEAASSCGPRICLGTHPEVVADMAGRRDDVDPVSLAEIIVRGAVTFPYTTRNGMRELQPGSCHHLALARGKPVRTTTAVWLPTEPERWPPWRESEEHLAQALSYAGTDITRGHQSVAVSLSGGFDSRTVLAAIPCEKRGCAYTFGDWHNREVRTAREVADTLGANHVLVLRPPDLYAHLGEWECALLGMERWVPNAHGFALLHAGGISNGDLLVGGFGSDALLKGSFCSRRVWLRSLVGLPARLPRLSPGDGVVLRPSVMEALRQRALQRLAEVAMVRPRTAAEWLDLYPLSRDRDVGYTLANFRLLAADELFLHTEVIRVACTASPTSKATRRLIQPAFARVLGCRASAIPHGEEGLSLSQHWVWHFLCRLLPYRVTKGWRHPRLDSGQPPLPWFGQGPWVNYRQLQLFCPAWSQARHRASSSAAMDLLSSVLAVHPAEFTTRYLEDAGALANYTIVCMLLHFGGLLRPYSVRA
jgi:asparagine synthetase B (glutamine-hydrolysing)